MRPVIFFTFTVVILIWLFFTIYLLGLLPAEMTPEGIKTLALPVTTAELGSSYALLNGLYLSLTVILGVIAVVVQGKSLQSSIQSQNEQTAALTFQIAQQNEANRLSAITAQLRYYQSESDRLDNQLDKLLDKLDTAREVKNDIIIKEVQPKIRDAQELRKTYAEITRELNFKIEKLLDYEPHDERELREES